jgi:iron complex outermembrane recepter protein
LQQAADQNTARAALQLTGQVGRFVWGVLGSYSRLTTNSSGAIGLDDAGGLALDLTNSALNTGNLQLSLSGRIATLPAGSVVTNIKAGFGYQGFFSEDGYPGAPLNRSNLVRTDRSASFNTSPPITSQDNHVGAAAGDLSATVNISLDDVSDFGALLSQSYGLDWLPIKKVHLNAIFTDHETPPTVQQVLAPETFTPNVEMFDFVTGQTVFVTSITGGAPNLRATDDRVASFGVSLGPFLGKSTFSAHYEQHRTRDAVGTLPPLTADVELAFPERFIRDADGTLTEVDNRSVNLQRQELNDLKWGFNAWLPFGSEPKGSTPNRFEFSVFDTWYLKDEILIRDGIPTLNLLNGAPSNGSGGQPRHQIDWTALLYKEGLGAALNGTWKSATSVSTGDALSSDTFPFSALGTLNLRLFADLSRLPATHDREWAHGMRVAVQVLNLFDHRQSPSRRATSIPSAEPSGSRSAKPSSSAANSALSARAQLAAHQFGAPHPGLTYSTGCVDIC